MTASATETAMLGLKAALDASSALPETRRDAVLDSLFEEFASGGETLQRAIGLRAGQVVDVTRRIGAGPNAYEIVREAEVEWFAAGKEGPELNAAFDAGIVAIFDALDVDATLGGVVTRAEINQSPELDTDAAGSYAVLTALIKVQLTYTSSRPY